MSLLNETRVFNRVDKIVEGWYWAIPSQNLRIKQVMPLQFLGKDLVLYRGENGIVVALDAYCPHMGAHLGEGNVEGNEIRCLFHYWKFNSEGNCTEIPCETSCSHVKKLNSWPVQEEYGLVWIWIGEQPHQSIPYIPELKDSAFEYVLGKAFTKECHPNVVMINAIDEQHFVSVHKLALDLKMEDRELNDNCILFSNSEPISERSWIRRFVKRFYQTTGTYELSYWFGNTGTVTIGPDFLHFHIMFALRPTANGKTEGQTILLTKKRPGIIGQCLSWIALRISQLASSYFAHGDTKIFRSIKFNLQTPIKADRSIIKFIQHLEKQAIADWGFSSKSEDKRLQPSFLSLARGERK